MSSDFMFAGGGLDSCTVVAGIPTEITTAGWFDSTYCDSALQVPSSGQVAFYPIDTTGARDTIDDGETGYFHFEMRCQFSGAANVPYAVLYDSAGFPWLRMCCAASGSNTLQLSYNSNTGASPTWTAVAPDVAATPASLVRYDIRVSINSAGSHSVELFFDNSSVYTGTFTQPLFTNVASLQCLSTSGNNAYSQVAIGRNLSTINAKIAYKRPTAIGNANAWTGAYTDIDEAVNNDADILLTAAAGNDYTFNYADVTVPANYSIRAVFNYARAKNDGASPTNLKSLCRNSGTTYASTNNLVGMGVGFNGVGIRYDADPATSAAWTQAGFNAAEWGMRSVA